MGARHAVATRLVVVVRDVKSACFVAAFTYVPSSSGSSNVSDHAIMSFHIIVKLINSVRRVDLHFERYIFAAQTVVDDYLILPKVLLVSVEFWDPRPVKVIYAGRLQ